MTNIPVCVIIASKVFKEHGSYYPQVLLHNFFYEHDINLSE